MKEILKQHLEFVARAKAAGVAFVQYACPRCSTKIDTIAPGVGSTWDSAACCPFCDDVHFKTVKIDWSGNVTTTAESLEISAPVGVVS